MVEEILGKEEIISLSEKGEQELELAKVPPSGREGDRKFTFEEIDNAFKDFYIRKPLISLVGSTAIHKDKNYGGRDIDLVIEGDLPDDLRKAIDFRLYRQMSGEFDIPYDDTPEYLQLFHKGNNKAFTTYVPLYSLKVERIKNPETIQMSDDSLPLHLKGSFDIISKAQTKKRVIAGYCSIIEVDKENHLIPKKALEDGIQSLLNDSDYSNLMLVHQNIQIGKIIPKYGNLKTHVDDTGLFIVATVRDDLDIANKIWKSILEGELNGFSIAAEVVKARKECDDTKCVKVIDKLNIFEVSVCLPPTQIIRCNPEDKEIQDVKVGDLVRTHKGNYKPVIRKFIRNYSGDLISIKPRFSPDEFKCTVNHPILVAITEKCKKYKSWVDINCNPNCERDCEYKPNEFNLQWIRADMLNKDKHLLAYPINKKVLSDEEILKNWDDDWVSIRNHRNGGLKKYHLLNKDFWRLVGYWLAEGSTSKFKNHFSVIFYPGGHEKENIEDIKNLITKFTNRKYYEHLSPTNAHSIQYADKSSYHFFQQFKKKPYIFGQKRIPSWILKLPLEFQVELIRGYFLGDKFTSVSKNLLKSIQEMLLRFKILVTLTKARSAGVDIIEGRKCNIQDSWALGIEKSNLRQLLGLNLIHKSKENHLEKWDDKYVYVPVSNVTREKYIGEVMNIEVADDNSYGGHLLSVHNCQKPVNAKSGFIVVSKGELVPVDNVVKNVIKSGDINMAKKVKKDITDEEVETEVISEEPVVEEEQPEETISLEAVIEELARQVATLTGIIQEMQAQKPEEEEEEVPEEEEEEEMAEEPITEVQPEVEIPVVKEGKPSEEKAKKPKDEEDEYPKPSKYPYPKKDFDDLKTNLGDLKKSIDSLISEVRKDTEIKDMKQVMKAKDDEIASLGKQVEILEKAEIKPKTTIEVEEKSEESEELEHSPKFVRDAVDTGTFYKDPDY